MSMYIESVPNRNSPPAILLRESYREDGKVRKRTLANLSLPGRPQLVEGLKVLLRGGVAVPSRRVGASPSSAACRTAMSRRCSARRAAAGSSAWFGSAPQELQPLLQAMLVARVLEPASKLATHRMLHDDTATLLAGARAGRGPVQRRRSVPGAGLAARGAAGHRAAPGAPASAWAARWCSTT